MDTAGCGELGASCCPATSNGPPTCKAGGNCDGVTGKCVACGGAGQECCMTEGAAGPQCGANLHCLNGKCGTCGNTGEMCCPPAPPPPASDGGTADAAQADGGTDAAAALAVDGGDPFYTDNNGCKPTTQCNSAPDAGPLMCTACGGSGQDCCSTPEGPKCDGALTCQTGKCG